MFLCEGGGSQAERPTEAYTFLSPRINQEYCDHLTTFTLFFSSAEWINKKLMMSSQIFELYGTILEGYHPQLLINEDYFPCEKRLLQLSGNQENLNSDRFNS